MPRLATDFQVVLGIVKQWWLLTFRCKLVHGQPALEQWSWGTEIVMEPFDTMTIFDETVVQAKRLQTFWRIAEAQ